MPVDEEGVNNFFSKNGGEVESPVREGRFALLITVAFSGGALFSLLRPGYFSRRFTESRER
mgnify:CR=1 FL=1